LINTGNIVGGENNLHRQQYFFRFFLAF